MLMLVTMLASCTKDRIILPNPDEEQASGAPLVIVIYGPNSLGDRSYCDLIYTGVERAAQRYGLRTLQFSPESDEEGLIAATGFDEVTAKGLYAAAQAVAEATGLAQAAEGEPAAEETEEA